jgi:hypothetical protein
MADLATQFPVDLGFAATNFNTITPALVSETNSGKIRRAGFGHSYYTWECQFPTLTFNQAKYVQGFLAQAAGQIFSFEIILPRLSSSAAASPTSTLNHGAASAGARSVSVTGTNNAQVIKSGDFFKFSGHTKVYQATSDLTLSAGGTGTLNFSGGLVQAITSGSVNRNGFAWTACLDEDTQAIEYGAGGLSRLSVKMREVWGV